MTEPEPIYMSRLSWQQAILMENNGISHNDLYELRRHAIGIVRLCDELLFKDKDRTIPPDKK